MGLAAACNQHHQVWNGEHMPGTQAVMTLQSQSMYMWLA